MTGYKVLYYLAVLGVTQPFTKLLGIQAATRFASGRFASSHRLSDESAVRSQIAPAA